MRKKDDFCKSILKIGIIILSALGFSIGIISQYTKGKIDNYVNVYNLELSNEVLKGYINETILGCTIIFFLAGLSFFVIGIKISKNKLLNKIRLIEEELKFVIIDDDLDRLKKSDDIEENIDGIRHSITEYKEKMNYYSKYDELTGLMNRPTFLIELDKEIEKNPDKKIIVIYINIDGFSYYNNNFGYHKGDAILKLVADEITKFIDIDSVIARLGGDEFAVMIKSEELNFDNSSEFVEGLLNRINGIKDIGVGGFISASIGICIKGDKEKTAAAMLNNAYLAMTTIKERQKNSYEFFTSKNKKDITLDMIERALERGDIQLHYQPKVNLKTNKIDGVEALVRWFDDEYGYISPFSFIKLTEETGYIITLGNWILNKAVRDIKQLNDELGTDISVAVNVSPIQFLQKSFVGEVEVALKESGLQAKNLELELTESIGMFNSHEVVEKFDRISKLGISIAIDDFGTGYSSIKYLKEFKINTIKIDRSFIQNGEKHRSIVRYIIDVSKTLGFKVVAEGVEDYMQARMLKEMECDYIQGYFFYKPMPIIRLREFVKK
ncbi:bifunctional diguanylate cyclase/phosphodiesterase [uncultured Clostridium sp.]|jgi:diguanylate cyclase (GGDEF)-like protein|uniref:putative bifunctional diguanylate cyclase/phosphodiesterase n=1 Tax=uncultured Clostridium sp. TaxID=59620 RepID=UPI00263A1385|nr:bifunctional diguanylate cyclase/phosphodiesterase [uncultured Clostridium sp.]